MSFLNRLGGIARNIGDKANEAIEITRLNSKISGEKTAMDEVLRQIGEFYYQKHQDGEPGDPGVAEYLAAVDQHNTVIADTQAEIARIQADNTQSAEQNVPQTPYPGAKPLAADAVPCPSCGKPNPVGTRFCSECGSKLEAPVPPEERVCPKCSARLSVTDRFCGECGHRFE